MVRALQLAVRARGRTAPNPLVGCVVARGATRLGEGWHHCAGEAHAEVLALADAGQRAREADLYVTLEPCHHTGRTGPCTAAILAAGVRRIFVAAADPDVRVQGRGLRYLRAHGVQVHTDLLAEHALRLNAAYNQVKRTGRAYFVAKVAQSLDGCVATRTGASQWITGPLARARGHALRNAVDAIVVGSATVRADDPRLTCRLVHGRDPARVVVASRAGISPRARVLPANSDSNARMLVLVGPSAPMRRRRALERAGAEIVVLPAGPGGVDLTAAACALAQRGLHAALVEGGPTLMGQLFDAGLVRRLHAFVAPTILGGENAKRSVLGHGAGSLTDAWALARQTCTPLGPDLWLRADVVAAHPNAP